MNEEIKLHESQVEGINFMLDAIDSNKEIVALIGAGGTGKSEILSQFKDSYHGDKKLHFTATTNKAVSRLKKDIPGTTTLHSATTRPKYTPLYNNLEDYYLEMPVQEAYPKAQVSQFKKDLKSYKDNFYWIQDSKNFFSEYYIDVNKFDSHMDIIASLKMTPFDELFFDRYIVKERIPSSSVLIDEASMLSTKSEYKNGSLVTIGVDTASKVFDNIILVGDNSQLPPINGTSSFDDVESYELTKNFRSEVDLLDAIQWARDGKPFYQYKPTSENVKIVHSIKPEWYTRTFGLDNVAHICYTNATRHSIVKRVRAGKGNKPEIGEPVILRGGNQGSVSKGEKGIYNGYEFEFESGLIKKQRWHYFDEYEKNKYAIFQYAYASTAHMYQGSAADHVIVHLYDIPGFIKDSDKIKWIYTAVSRARKTITIIL